MDMASCVVLCVTLDVVRVCPGCAALDADAAEEDVVVVVVTTRYVPLRWAGGYTSKSFLDQNRL